MHHLLNQPPQLPQLSADALVAGLSSGTGTANAAQVQHAAAHNLSADAFVSGLGQIPPYYQPSSGTQSINSILAAGQNSQNMPYLNKHGVPSRGNQNPKLRGQQNTHKR